MLSKEIIDKHINEHKKLYKKKINKDISIEQAAKTDGINND